MTGVGRPGPARRLSTAVRYHIPTPTGDVKDMVDEALAERARK
jgi:hypothetical protein